MFKHESDNIAEACGIEKDRWDELGNEVGFILAENEDCISKILEAVNNMEATDIEKIAMSFMVGGFVTEQINALKTKEALLKDLFKKAKATR